MMRQIIKELCWIRKAIRHLLHEQYSSEFRVIDGLSQHPQTFEVWLTERGLGEKKDEEGS